LEKKTSMFKQLSPKHKLKNHGRVMLLFFIALCSTGYADINSDMANFFKELGYEGNSTPPSSYQGQAAGYYSGGGVAMRGRVRNIQLMHVDLPSVQAGCGGINIFTGGLSFIKAEALVDFLRSIMNNAVGYAMNLALETMTPQIAHTLKWAQNVAQEINASNMNSCEMAEGLVGGLWPRSKIADEQICKKSGGIKKNGFQDWAEARHKCGESEIDRKKAMDNAENDSEYKNAMLRNKNLIWDAIKNKSFLAHDNDLRQLFMSISGTVVFDQGSKVHIFTPLAKDKTLLKAMLTGGAAEAYICTEKDKCLNVHKGNINISDKDALYNKVKKTIYDIRDTLRDKEKDAQGLSDASKNFLEMTRVPVLEFIKVHLTAGDLIAATSIADYSEAIAKTILKEYINEALDTVEYSLAGTNYPPDTTKYLVEQIQQSRLYIDNIKTEARNDIHELMNHIEHSKQAERETASKISGQMKNLMGGG
jgi:conjugative transfer pilus assembly protein TraH